MSAANNVMPATAKAETSLALSLAKTRDSLTEISPLLKQVKDVLDSNVLKTASLPHLPLSLICLSHSSA